MRGRNFKNLPSSRFPNPKKRKRKEGEWEKEEKKGREGEKLRSKSEIKC